MVIMIEEELMAEDWEDGLPSPDELTPISHTLISPQLANAFCIDIGAIRSPTSNLAELPACFQTPATPAYPIPPPINSSPSTRGDEIEHFSGTRGSFFLPLHIPPSVKHFPALPSINTTVPGEKYENFGRLSMDWNEGGEAKCGKNGRDATEESPKKPRLVWSEQLHNRFVEVVHRLGVNQAVPKAIMDLMGVDGVTRENIASHLQKYRLNLKRASKNPPPPSSGRFISFNPSSPTPLIPPSLYSGSPPPTNMLTLFPPNHY